MLLILDTTTRTLKAKMDMAAMTTNCSVIVAYADHDGTNFTEGVDPTTLNGTTAVTILSAPASATRRVVKSITVYNPDDEAHTTTLIFNDNGTEYGITRLTLPPGASWSSDDQTGVNVGGALTDGDKGDISVSGGGDTWTIDTNAVTLTKLAQISSGSFLGRSTAGTGNVEEIGSTGSGNVVRATSATLTTPSIAALANLTTNGFVRTGSGNGTLSIDTNTYLTSNQAITLSGDVTGTGTTGITATIANQAVSYAKIQNVSATSRILGRRSAGAGSIEEMTLSQTLDLIGSAAQGDILYRGAAGWARLGAGSSGQVLRTNGTGADPSWATVSASPGGSNTQIQFNNSGAFGANEGLIYNTSTANRDVTISSFAGTASHVWRRAEGTSGSPTAVQPSTTLGNLLWQAHNGTSYVDAARINVTAIQLYGATTGDALMSLSVKPTGTTSLIGVAIRATNSNTMDFSSTGASNSQLGRSDSSYQWQSIHLSDGVRLYNGSNSNVLLLKSGISTSNITLTFPTTDGDANQVLTTDGSGVLSWATPSVGLTNNNTTISSTNVSAVANNRYFATIAGLTANRDFILPTPAVGDRIELSIVDGDDAFALLIKGTTGVTINGGSAASEWSRLFIRGETVTFLANTTSNWQVIVDGRIPSTARIAFTGTTYTGIASGSSTQITLNTSVFDNGSFVDTTNSRLKIRRTGKYVLAAALRFVRTGNPPYAEIPRMTGWIRQTDTAEIIQLAEIYASTGTASPGLSIAAIFEMTEGKTLDLFTFQNSGANQAPTSTSGYPHLEMTEVLT